MAPRWEVTSERTGVKDVLQNETMSSARVRDEGSSRGEYEVVMGDEANLLVA